MSGLTQNSEFLDQLLGGVETILLAFGYDVVLAALQAAVDQQADVLAGGLGTFPVALTSLLVLVVGIQDWLLVLLAFSVAGWRWHSGNFLQAWEFGLDFSIADDVRSGVQDGFGLGLLFGISWIIALTNASADVADFSAVFVPFLWVQSWDDWLRITFGQLLTEFTSLGQRLGEPFAVFVLHNASTRAAVTNVLDVPLETVFRHGESRT